MFIAITLRYEKHDEKEYFLINKNFKDIFDTLGVTLIPVCQESEIDKISEICSALILTGSPIHVDAQLYKEKSSIDYTPEYPFEDSLDYKLIETFKRKGKPILGICRGIQILNVYHGGTLKEKVPNHEGTMHKIKIVPNSFLGSIYKGDIMVNSSHTQ